MSLRTDADFFLLLADSYRRLLNRPLVPDGLNAADGAAWLYDAAPFGILAHDTSADPVFVYGNKRAQAIFEYGWDELTALPSRLSAEPMERRERQSFLEKVARDGFVSDYRGVRVTKSGKRFWIERATVWQLVDAGGIVRGQAAMIPQVRTIDPGA
ncbi:MULTISPECIES: MEKHLA domain-containing protein [Burkholderia]|jgi:PAS domain-containing protein|uniref:MEKHLA domain-containing protein n=1 Tax=Burkholderia multivorans TaxID=87883 RepID=A0A8E2RY07_9BURK|nr:MULTISPECIES: MEKHLA domain-containing protein [Burkholderia]EEE00528.1 mekhla domain superfamily [Burkholderia multivorans CGD1]EKS9916034.1 MEKHLA domain-containing protein [Burkholderia multivorans]KOE22680.1 MEKHLA domain-containing protein [Burkholderia multivorans R-20526]MBH9664854.1 MEKHLA domain-containing protein [Burkholderia multivorans]MBJ9681223.1 MEKHLA domain-containing protein [Burkholderia multivorans]